MILKQTYFKKKKLDTIVGPQNKHTIEDQGFSWATPLNNWLNAVFVNWVLIGHHIISWGTGHS